MSKFEFKCFKLLQELNFKIEVNLFVEDLIILREMIQKDDGLKELIFISLQFNWIESLSNQITLKV